MAPHLPKSINSIDKVIIGIWMLIGICLAASSGQAQDGTNLNFEADIITVEQDNNIMVAQGGIRITHENEVLEAQLLEYNRSSGIAKAIGEVKLKTKDGAEYRADELFLDNNFKLALANPLISSLSNKSKFSLKKGNSSKRKRTVFDRGAFPPCNCGFDEGQSPVWDLKASNSEKIHSHSR